ncbi:MAG: hypothetical protein AVDCRST_MAG89-2474, partial [uncultured Gemmatimonadetes bacterium]
AGSGPGDLLLRLVAGRAGAVLPGVALDREEGAKALGPRRVPGGGVRSGPAAGNADRVRHAADGRHGGSRGDKPVGTHPGGVRAGVCPALGTGIQRRVRRPGAAVEPSRRLRGHVGRVRAEGAQPLDDAADRRRGGRGVHPPRRGAQDRALQPGAGVPGNHLVRALPDAHAGHQRHAKAAAFRLGDVRGGRRHQHRRRVRELPLVRAAAAGAEGPAGGPPPGARRMAEPGGPGGGPRGHGRSRWGQPGRRL